MKVVNSVLELRSLKGEEFGKGKDDRHRIF